MRIPYKKILNDPKKLLLLLILVGFGILIESFALNEKSLQGKVVKVIDGDTIELLDHARKTHRIRLFGIDAPETKQEYGEKSREHLANFIAGKEVKAIIKDRDKYDRILAIIEFEGKDINKLMVEDGFAWAYLYYSEKYKKEFEIARAKKIGLWANKNPMEPYKWRKKNLKAE